MDAKSLAGLGKHLFSKKTPLDSLWQEIADNFYPERATFTIKRSLGFDFASNLMSSYPILCRRDLGNQFGSMLRPVAEQWFHTGIQGEENLDNETDRWLKSFEVAQRKIMYSPKSQFTKATKLGDHDFAAFGQCSISCELNKYADGMTYRCWHLKDMAWQEDELGEIGAAFRKWKTTAEVLSRTFGKDKVHKDIRKSLEKEPYTEYTFMHMVVTGDMYGDNARGRPYWHIWYDTDHDELVSAIPAWTAYYVIPRWQTHDSQYSYSPATVAALPDARLLQAMTWTLLEAGERATWPPMVATIDAVKSDIGNFAGGITWIDPNFEGKSEDALRPLTQDFRGFNFGRDLNEDARAMIFRAFYLDTLALPERGPEMTAYEVSQRIQQYIRDALPIFEPMEMDYNAKLCDMTFEILWRQGVFGSRLDWPKKLQEGVTIDFQFESPLHDAIEQMKGQKLIEGENLIAAAMQLDPSVGNILDSKEALRDALNGIGVPPTWLRSESDVDEIDAAQAEEAEQAQMLEQAEQAAAATKDFSAAGKTISETGAV